jgi:hypothetical protein
MAIDENDPRLKDMLRAIELGDLPEDLPPDPEEYDDMGGINSLKRKAPSIKMASETGAEEFELELGTVIAEYNDLKSKGDPAVRGISLDEYINDYLSKKKMMKMMEENRAMAMGGGMMRMGYAGGTGDEKIVEPSKSMQVDTTTGEDANIFPISETKDGPLRKIDLDVEMIKKLIEKRKKEKKKLAMGGIAGVL